MNNEGIFQSDAQYTEASKKCDQSESEQRVIKELHLKNLREISAIKNKVGNTVRRSDCLLQALIALEPLCGDEKLVNRLVTEQNNSNDDSNNSGAREALKRQYVESLPVSFKVYNYVWVQLPRILNIATLGTTFLNHIVGHSKPRNNLNYIAGKIRRYDVSQHLFVWNTFMYLLGQGLLGKVAESVPDFVNSLGARFINHVQKGFAKIT